MGKGPIHEHRFWRYSLLKSNNVVIFHATVPEMGIYFSNNKIITNVNANLAKCMTEQLNVDLFLFVYMNMTHVHYKKNERRSIAKMVAKTSGDNKRA